MTRLLFSIILVLASALAARANDGLVVWIECTAQDDRTSFGNGVIISETGLVLTAAHVFPGRGATCTGTVMGQRYDMRPLAQSFAYDGMLMELSGEHTAPLDFARFCPIDASTKGREVRALAYHKSATVEPTETDGIISRSVEQDGLIAMTPMTNAGKSGGPVFVKDTNAIVGIIAGAVFDNSGVIIEFSVVPAGSLAAELGRMEEAVSCAPPANGYTIEQHEVIVTQRLDEAEENFERILELEKRASDAERQLLQAEKENLLNVLDELRRDKEDMQSSFEERGSELADMEAKLQALQDGSISKEELRQAQAALSQGDTTLAEGIFRKISEEKTAATRQRSLAEFGLGTIAADKFDWVAAASHYATAANLDPIYAHLFKASEYAWRVGEYVDAEYFSKNLVDQARSEFGDQTEALAAALNELAVALHAAGAFEDAEPLYREAMDITAEVLGQDHPAYGMRLNNLATVLAEDRRFDEAEPLFKKAIKNAQWTIGTDNAFYAARLNNYAALLAKTRRIKEAEQFYRASLDISARTIGKDHPDYATRLSNYAALLAQDRRYFDAEPLFIEAIDIARRTVGETHPSYAVSLNNFGDLLLATDRRDEARDYFENAYQVMRDTLGDRHNMTLQVRRNIDAATQVE